MHSDSTLKHLEALTRKLGKLMRDFEKKICSKFTAVELPREAEARKRRRAAGDQSGASAARVKKLNLFTYKWHSLADYVPHIRLFGGSDGFSSQIVRILTLIHISVYLTALQGELAHRLVKRLYGLTNKRNAPKQIAKRYRRMERAREAMRRHRIQVKHQHQLLSDLLPSKDLSDDPDLRYYVSSSQNDVVPLYTMLHRSGASDDPALKVSHGLRFANIGLTPFYRTFCQNSKSTFLVGCLDMTSTETITGHSHHLNASTFVFWVTRCTLCKPVAFITRHTTFAENQTRSILPPAPIS